MFQQYMFWKYFGDAVGLLDSSLIEICFFGKRKAMIWLVIHTAAVNVVSVISRCLQLFCSYVGHLGLK